MRFGSGLNVAEQLDLSTQTYELNVDLPSTLLISRISGLQAHLDKTTMLIAGTSGVSGGDSLPDTGPAHRIACYESGVGSSYTSGFFFYGIGLCV